jgi:hypothetical protein
LVALAAEPDQRPFLDLAAAGVVDPDLGGLAAGGDQVEVALVDAHLVGADNGFGGACGHQAAQFLDGERTEEVSRVGQQLADQPHQRVDVVIDAAGPGGGVEHPGLDVGREHALFTE